MYLTFTHHTRRPLKHRHHSPPLYVKVESTEENEGPVLKENTTKDTSPQPPPSTPTKARTATSPSTIVTPKAVRNSLAKSPESVAPKKNLMSPGEHPQINGTQKKGQNSEGTESKGTAKERIIKSPTSPRPPSNLRLKSPDKSSSNTSRKASPKELKLPKLAASPPLQDNNTPITETHSKITLPKLIETSGQPARVAH